MFLAALAVPAAAGAQSVRGVVLDAEGEIPLADVEVLLVDTAGTVHHRGVTDRQGRFALEPPVAGTYSLRAVHIAYEPVESARFAVAVDEVLEVELRLSGRAIPLEPLTVVARRRESIPEQDLREFRERAERWPHLVGRRILTRAELERLPGWTIGDVVRRYSPSFRRGAFRCAPKIYWNGYRIHPLHLDGGLSSESLEGVEFYPGFGPPGYLFADEDGCGVILLWSRRS